jgi:hypothetical protein
MPEFGSPFSGLGNDRKLTDEELIRAIRFMIAAEYEAIQLYMQNRRTTSLPLRCLKTSLMKSVFMQGSFFDSSMS